jgi:hypothetical protein
MAGQGVWLYLNGRGGDFPDNYFDPIQLEKGIRVEMEHTDDPEVAKIIAKGHLYEFSDYYDYLDEMELQLKQRECVRRVFGW